MNKFVVISGCSGGGKSTLLSELRSQGYAVIEEVGRNLVKEQIAINSGITPWQDLKSFCELLIDRSIDALHQAKKINPAKADVIFFDRSFLEGISYFQTLNITKYDHFIDELRYYQTIFMTPPWQEIYIQDEERQHSYDEGLEEYERLLKYYPMYGYQISEIPKISVDGRVHFILKELASSSLSLFY